MFDSHLFCFDVKVKGSVQVSGQVSGKQRNILEAESGR